MYISPYNQEFNDDDFEQQGSPPKKVKMTLIQADNGSNDQISKYARILTKFVKDINEGRSLHYH